MPRTIDVGPLVIDVGGLCFKVDHRRRKQHYGQVRVCELVLIDFSLFYPFVRRFQDTQAAPISALFPFIAISFWTFAWSSPKIETTFYAATLNRLFQKYFHTFQPLYGNTQGAFRDCQYHFYLCFKFINVYPVRSFPFCVFISC